MCGFCQNPNLIVEVDKTPTISQEEFFDFLEKRKKWLDGVVITGGEPCLYEDLAEFVGLAKSAHTALVGKLYEQSLLDRVNNALETFRAEKAQK